MKKKDIKIMLARLDSVPMPSKDAILSGCFEKELPDDLKVAQNASRKTTVKPSYRPRRPVIVLAVISVILIAGVSAGCAYESKTYNDAFKYFNEHNISIEGLSRSDIKKVYKDIINGTFSFKKTFEVIENHVGGFEIDMSALTPEELKERWKDSTGINYINPSEDVNNVKYVILANVRFDDKHQPTIDFNSSSFRKVVDGETEWEISLDIFIHGYVETNDGILLYSNSSGTFVKINTYGEILWKKALPEETESVLTVVSDDETYAVFSRRNRFMAESDNGDTIYVTKYNKDGDRISRVSNAIQSTYFNIGQAMKLGDKYVLHFKPAAPEYFDFEGTHGTIYFAKFSEEGKFIGYSSCRDKETNYKIVDMFEYEGKLYISANSFSSPIIMDFTASELEERKETVDYKYSSSFKLDPYDIYDITPEFRSDYSATLLVLDLSKLEVKEFLSVKGSLAGGLIKNSNGELAWYTNNIYQAYATFSSNSYIFSGTGGVTVYNIDQTGVLKSINNTKYISSFIQ